MNKNCRGCVSWENTSYEIKQLRENVPWHIFFYISLRNNAVRSSMLASFGLPGAHASAWADSARNGRSSSLMASSLDGMPTSSESFADSIDRSFTVSSLIHLINAFYAHCACNFTVFFTGAVCVVFHNDRKHHCACNAVRGVINSTQGCVPWNERCRDRHWRSPCLRYTDQEPCLHGLLLVLATALRRDLEMISIAFKWNISVISHAALVV